MIRSEDEPRDPPWTLTTRNGSLRPDGNGGYWIEPHRSAEHQCPLPQQWAPRALWQCPEGHLWTVVPACECRGHIDRHRGRGTHSMGLMWLPASWWQRRKYGPGMKRARLSMADRGERVQGAVKPRRPPTGRGGVSYTPPPRFAAPSLDGTPPTDFDG